MYFIYTNNGENKERIDYTKQFRYLTEILDQLQSKILFSNEVLSISFNDEIFYGLFQNDMLHKIQAIEFKHVVRFIKMLVENYHNCVLLRIN